MKLFLAAFLFLTCMMVVPAVGADAKAPKANTTVKHVVCFKFKDGTSADQIRSMEKEFAQLKNKIAGIVRFEHGANNSPEALNKGFTHCYIATFKDTAARDAYLPHVAHKEFVEKHLKPILDDVFVIDFGGK